MRQRYPSHYERPSDRLKSITKNNYMPCKRTTKCIYINKIKKLIQKQEIIHYKSITCNEFDDIIKKTKVICVRMCVTKICNLLCYLIVFQMDLQEEIEVPHLRQHHSESELLPHHSRDHFLHFHSRYYSFGLQFLVPLPYHCFLYPYLKKNEKVIFD